MKHLVFKRGLRDGIPIGLGYFVVSIGIGIACRTAKLGAVQGFFMSLLNNASAGEYGGITVIAGDAGFLTMILMMLVINARYLLMGCVLSQKLSPDLSLGHRMLMAFDLTDEIFGRGGPAGHAGPLVLLRRHVRRPAGLELRHRGGRAAGAEPAGVGRQRLLGNAFRHVYRHHPAGGEAEPGGARLYPSELPLQLGGRQAAAPGPALRGDAHPDFDGDPGRPGGGHLSRKEEEEEAE